MREFKKSNRLLNVSYEVRGPVVDAAAKMEAEGTRVLKLNIGNPAPFSFCAPDEVIYDMKRQLTECEGYSDSRGLFSARKAIMQYAQLKNIPNVTMDDIYTGNGYGYGNTVVLKHEYNNVVFYTLYGHMRDRSVKVEKGDTVSAGQILGTMGSTGTSTGDHVHVSVFTGSYKAGSTIPAGYYSGLFSGTSVKYKGFKFYDARQLIKTEGSILTN